MPAYFPKNLNDNKHAFNILGIKMDLKKEEEKSFFQMHFEKLSMKN